MIICADEKIILGGELMVKIKDFVWAILAGIVIAIGGVVNLSMSNNVVGAVLFSIGLFYVVTCGLNLFTGKVGYLVNNFNKNYSLYLIVVWLGNLVGTYIVGSLMRLTRHQALIEKAINICTVKNNDTYLSIFILAFFCGLLMFLAVDNYRKIDDSMGKNFSIIICVAVFILAGFEHCIANMFYYSIAGMWSFNTLTYVLVMSIGNGVGGCLVPFLAKVCSDK